MLLRPPIPPSLIPLEPPLMLGTKVLPASMDPMVVESIGMFERLHSNLLEKQPLSTDSSKKLTLETHVVRVQEKGLREKKLE